MAKNKRKKYTVAFVTGSRAEFGYWKRPLLALQAHPAVDVYVVATAMHTMRGFGSTVAEVEASGLRVKKISDGNNGKDLASLAASVGNNISKMTGLFAQERPDLVIVTGDRGEQLAAAAAAAYLNIPLMHQGGGNISGSIDNKLRNAITAFADYHLPSNAVLAKNLELLGVPKKRIYVLGSPVLDDIVLKEYDSKAAVKEAFGLKEGPTLLLVFHPNTQEHGSELRQIREVLGAIAALKYQTIAIGGNADGGAAINKELQLFARKHPFVRYYAHVPRRDYLGLLNTVDVLVGNTSSGFSELPSFKKPYVCIGTRQQGRVGETRHIITAATELKDIVAAIQRALNPAFIRSLRTLKNPYGVGAFYKKLPQLLVKILKTHDA